MAYYIGTKLVKAEPAYICISTGKVVKETDGVSKYSLEPGYLIDDTQFVYKDKFEKEYLKVEDNPKLPSGVSIGPKMVDDFIKEIHIETLGQKTTLVRATLVNGFEIIETSTCVDPENYSEKIGSEICLEKIKDKIWYLLGFLLQTAYMGVK